ncbi:hypothetical protein NEFER03_0351 [Nematocida sp. LUAm3]|nr:hypothetical protein NEFER03_0351 [Nematocida sp. LUAm3]KAI5175871.1 hypothetical protein NEFER02_1731 [Nematocida sp. LUAm2]KAI5178664.1 hypothetical protein NEFER01_1783 [Nematocida sp. LUAm1]
MLLSQILDGVSHRILVLHSIKTLSNSGKVKKRKQGMIKILCLQCNTQVNSVVFTRHLERCSEK